MANSKKRLGRGLGGLISGTSDKSPETSATTKSSGGKAKTVAAENLSNVPPTDYVEIALKDLVASPYQPRREIAPEQIEALASSIRAEGLLQPIVVRAKGKRYELIAGERRWRAFEFLKRKKIPARIIDASDASSATLALIENLQRENLNPIDEALGYASLVRDFDLTQEKVAERVGKSRASVANALRLLSLEEELQSLLSQGALSTGHAKVLLGLDDESQRRLLAQQITERGMSVREAEQRVRELKEQPLKKTPKKKTKPASIRALEKRIGNHLNTRCVVDQGSKKSRLTIEYTDDQDLERILDKLGLSD